MLAKRNLIFRALVLCVSMLATTSQAQTPQRQTPCADAAYRAFDFWLGTWEVFGIDAQGKVGAKAGTNVITSQEQGCLILEQWTGISGGTGQSYNYYDPSMQRWRQLWISAAATIDYEGGLNEAGEMLLEGDIVYRNGTVAPFKGKWTPKPDGTIIQHFDQYNAQTEQWAPWFTGLYKKLDDKEAAEQAAQE